MTTVRWEFEAIGTRWRIDTAVALPSATRAAVDALIEAFDRDWSRFRDDSLVSALARGEGTVAAPPDTVPMLEVYDALDAATGGGVNPLVGGALARRGYDADYSFADRGVEAAPADWRTRIAWTEDALTLTEPATIDVGAVGKGCLVDRVMELVTAGDRDAVVDASGDIAVRGGTERIALEHPFDPTRAIGVWEVTDAALCASAVNRRAWGDSLHHVLDARTGHPVDTIAATWAVAGSALRADAIATALFFDGGPRLAHDWGVSWVRMTTDGRREWSAGCAAELFA